MTISPGRQNTDAQPNGATASLSISAGALAHPPEIGDAVVIMLGEGARAVFGLDPAEFAGAADRFHGAVSDAKATLDGKGRAIYSLAAVSRRARLGRTYIGAEPWPEELDGARAGRILGLADVDVTDVDIGTVLLARDIDHQPALGLLDAVAQDSGGVLCEDRDGSFDYHDAEHRRNTPPSLTLAAAQVLSPLAWEQAKSGMVNDLTVIYGPGEGDARGSVQVVDQPSIDAFGPFAAKVETQLATADDAGAFARLTVARRSRPWWRAGSMTVALLRTAQPGQAGALLG